MKKTFYWVFLVLLLWALSPPSNAQTIVIDPVSGTTITVNTSEPLVGINNNPNSTMVQLWDDGSAQVPLEFMFPFYDREFNQSVMFSNGTVSFGPRRDMGYNFCCNGLDLTTLNPDGSLQYNYSIFMLWTDLFSQQNNTFYLSEPTSMTYGWYGSTEYGNPSVNNSFELQIYESGDIDMRYGSANIQNHVVTIGILGDVSQSQYTQLYHGYRFSLADDFTVEQPVSPCDLDPLYSTICVGYEEAYYNQQCSLNPLYDSGCPGYQAAYYNQQCNVDPLYDSQCPGYAVAYAQIYILPGLEEVATITTTFEGEPALSDYLADTTINLASYDNNEAFEALVEASDADEQEMAVEEKKEEKLDTRVKTVAEVRAAAANLARTMSEAATFQAQQQAQAEILSVIGMLPGFEAYYTSLPDATFYETKEIYQNVKLEENKRALRIGLASEVKFEEMLKIQYALGD